MAYSFKTGGFFYYAYAYEGDGELLPVAFFPTQFVMLKILPAKCLTITGRGRTGRRRTHTTHTNIPPVYKQDEAINSIIKSFAFCGRAGSATAG